MFYRTTRRNILAEQPITVCAYLICTMHAHFSLNFKYRLHDDLLRFTNAFRIYIDDKALNFKVLSKGSQARYNLLFLILYQLTSLSVSHFITKRLKTEYLLHY